jgi:hypothetical protein
LKDVLLPLEIFFGRSNFIWQGMLRSKVHMFSEDASRRDFDVIHHPPPPTLPPAPTKKKKQMGKIERKNKKKRIFQTTIKFSFSYSMGSVER